MYLFVQTLESCVRFPLKAWIFICVGRGFPTRLAVFDLRSGHVGFEVDKVTLGQVFFEYFGLPCQLLFRRLPHIHHLSSGASTISQIVADVLSGLSLTPLQTKKRNYLSAFILFVCRQRPCDGLISSNRSNERKHNIL
jgi:hypothetical protein